MIVFTHEPTGCTRIFYVDRMDVEELELTMAYYEDVLGYIANTVRLYK